MSTHRPYLTPVVILVTLALGAVLTIATMQMEQRIAGARFDRLADLIASRMQQRIAQHITSLSATRSFFEAKPGSVSAAEFGDFIGNLAASSPDLRGIQGIGFAPLLPTTDTQRAAARIGQDNGAEIVITPAVTPYDQIGPIALLEPRDERNRHALGYDMFSEPVRHAAMTDALQSGAPRASAPVELVQEITAAKQAGFLIFLPTRAGLFETFPDRTGGFIYAPFRAGDLHQAVLDDLPDLPVALRTEDSATHMVLFNTLPDGIEGRTTREIDVAGRVWLVAMAPMAGFGELSDHSAGITVGLLSLLLVAAVWQTLRSSRHAVAAAERTAAVSAAQAEERTLLLREMQHRIKNHIARIQAIARQTMRNADDLDAFGRVFGARLAAMAKAQDALSRDVWGTADLRQILRGEIGQVMDGERIEAIMQGDEVRLDGRAAQALGLVAHELATNAMKYSGQDELALGVSWQVVPKPGGNWLELRWTEPDARAPVDAASPGGGFGSQLIEALIEGDLQGRFSRRFDDGGMTVKIAFPLAGV